MVYYVDLFTDEVIDIVKTITPHMATSTPGRPLCPFAPLPLDSLSCLHVDTNSHIPWAASSASKPTTASASTGSTAMGSPRLQRLLALLGETGDEEGEAPDNDYQGTCWKLETGDWRWGC